MRIYTTPNECYVPGKGWVKPETLGNNWNEVTQINYNYIDIVFINEKTGLIDGINGKKHITTGQADVTIEESRNMLYKDGCRIHRSEFFPM